MSALTPGTKAPEVSLQTIVGEKLSLTETLQSNSIVVLAFFKVSCPVCQFALPFLERIHRRYPQVPIWGISQDDAADTNKLARSHDATFPMLLDEHLGSTVDYDLTNVPTIFVVAADGFITKTIIGFAKADFEQLNAIMANATNSEPEVMPLFTEADDVPTLRPG